MNRIADHCKSSLLWLLTLFFTLTLSTSLNAAPQKTEIPMPGPWGDDFSETITDPEQVGDTASTQRFRQQQMQMLSAYYRSLEQALRYSADHHGQLENLASNFAHRAQQLPDWFRERTPAHGEESGALERVWEAPERFQQHMEQFRERAADLADRVERSSDAVQDEAVEEKLNRVRHQCLACHQEFRHR